jgi:hypothetical protein
VRLNEEVKDVVDEMVRLGAIDSSLNCRAKEDKAMEHTLILELEESLQEERDYWIEEIIGKIYFYYIFISPFSTFH